MKYNVYFKFPTSENINVHGGVKIYLFWITYDLSIDLLQCTSELPMPLTFLFVNENIKCGYAFS